MIIRNVINIFCDYSIYSVFANDVQQNIDNKSFGEVSKNYFSKTKDICKN